jgi:hypothetical protein
MTGVGLPPRGSAADTGAAPNHVATSPTKSIQNKKTWLQHRGTMTSTWQNNVCNTSINFKKHSCNITKIQLQHHKKHG